jgi:leader peptidase (prepilin peptidase) / N-methyltransferase
MSEALAFHWIWLVIAGPFIGSFLAVVILRWPSGESILTPRSACRHCGHPLGIRELVPIVSWLSTRGRCRYCATPLGFFYPTIELGALLVPVWAVAVLSGWLLWASCLLGWTLLTLAVLDQRYMVLYDHLTLPLIAFGIVVKYLLAPEGVIDHVFGAAGGFVALLAIGWAYRRIRRREGLGLGDAKLTAAAGAWVSWVGLPSVVFLAATFALAVAIVRALFGHPISPDMRIPFGPYLCLATWVVWLHGPLVFG